MARKHFLTLIFLLNFTSCTLIDGFHSKLNSMNKDSSSQEFISKDKYDRLLVKYESLKIEKNKSTQAPVTEKIPSNLNEEIVFFRKTMDEITDHDEQVQRYLMIITSENIHLRARVMFALAKTYESSDECDQSLPLIDELINHHAFSGVVLPALALGIKCSERLNIPAKVTSYASLLEIFVQ